MLDIFISLLDQQNFICLLWLKTKTIRIYFPLRCLKFKYSVIPDLFILTSHNVRLEPLDFLEPTVYSEPM